MQILQQLNKLNLLFNDDGKALITSLNTFRGYDFSQRTYHLQWIGNEPDFEEGFNVWSIQVPQEIPNILRQHYREQSLILTNIHNKTVNHWRETVMRITGITGENNGDHYGNITINYSDTAILITIFTIGP